MKIKMHAVKSSNIRGVGYDEASKTLAIEFKKGARWHYTDVPAQVASGLIASTSTGGFFARNIRGRFAETKIVRKAVAK